jgi:hypothetical protein
LDSGVSELTIRDSAITFLEEISFAQTETDVDSALVREKAT